jgi:hypothetical protein
MFCFSNPNKEIIYDIYIGYNTRERVEYYYKYVHKSESLEDNDWIKWSKDNYHHNIKPGKKGRVEYDPLFHKRTI